MLVLGGCIVALYLVGLVAPAGCRSSIRRFPRHRIAGWVLVSLDLLWAGYLVYHARVDLIYRYRQAIFVLVPLCFYLITTYMEELLAARAFGGFLMLLPAPILHAARMSHSDWWYLPSILAYVFVVQGMILMLSPHRFRTMMAFWVRDDARFRLGGVLGVLLGLVLLALGWFVY